MSYLHKVLLHIVCHKNYNLFLAVELLRQRAGLESEMLVVGQAVVDRPVGGRKEGKSIPLVKKINMCVGSNQSS